MLPGFVYTQFGVRDYDALFNILGRQLDHSRLESGAIKPGEVADAQMRAIEDENLNGELIRVNRAPKEATIVDLLDVPEAPGRGKPLPAVVKL